MSGAQGICGNPNHSHFKDGMHLRLKDCSYWREVAEPVASPQATRPDEIERLAKAYAVDMEMHDAAQPAAGTTPLGDLVAQITPENVHKEHWPHECKHLIAECAKCGTTIVRKSTSTSYAEASEATAPQAERICGNCGLPLVRGETEEMCRELEKVSTRLEKARAVAPVETPEQCLDLWHKEKGCNAALLKCPTCGLSKV